jgi:hypothetical protein
MLDWARGGGEQKARWTCGGGGLFCTIGVRRGRESNAHGPLGRAIRATTIQIGPRSRTLSYGPSSGQELGGRAKVGQGLATLPGRTPGLPGRRRGQLAPDARFCCECRKAFARASAARALSSFASVLGSGCPVFPRGADWTGTPSHDLSSAGRGGVAVRAASSSKALERRKNLRAGISKNPTPSCVGWAGKLVSRLGGDMDRHCEPVSRCDPPPPASAPPLHRVPLPLASQLRGGCVSWYPLPRSASPCPSNTRLVWPRRHRVIDSLPSAR